MDGFKLNDFCKVYKTSLKNDMDHDQARLLLLRDYETFGVKYYDLLTDFFNYAVQDINVLIELVNNSRVIEDNITLCKELNCSL
jgi:hypothetical protein